VRACVHRDVEQALAGDPEERLLRRGRQGKGLTGHVHRKLERTRRVHVAQSLQHARQVFVLLRPSVAERVNRCPQLLDRRANELPGVVQLGADRRARRHLAAAPVDRHAHGQNPLDDAVVELAGQATPFSIHDLVLRGREQPPPELPPRQIH